MTRILIVDDNPTNLSVLRALLEGHGHEVVDARHGAEALVKARLDHPSLIVCDLLMPVMDGFTLLRHWKGDEHLKPIPFMVYTATYTEPKDERLALSLGADAFVLKPADPEDFMRQVRTLLLAVERGHAPAVGERNDADPRMLSDYNEVLVGKLQKRANQLAQTNRELTESEERFRATFEQAAVGLSHVDLDGRLVRVNDKLCEITGYPRDELLGMGVFEMTTPEDQAEAEAACKAMIDGTPDSYSVEKRFRKKNGEWFWAHLVATPARDSAGQARYLITAITDVSQRHALQDQLQQSQKLDAIGQLTGGIAHDFNNLLTVILGNADLLVEGLADNPELRASAEMARTAASRGADLTQRLLAFARQQALDPRAVDANEILAGMEQMLRRMLPEHIDVEHVRCGVKWRALVDPVQLEAAVLNLAINARDAMPDGGYLTIETTNVRLDEEYASQRAGVKAGEYVLVSVSDTGTGIAPEHLAKVFDPFFSTKPIGKGTGLGLSMIYGLVKQSGGHVSIYSELGHGTTVKVYLPRASAADPSFPAKEVETPHASSGSEYILLVEDDALVRQYAEQQLLSLGYRVATASDGASALRIIEADDALDLLLTDVVMPGGMNGRQLAEATRVIRPHLKVLFCSGYSENAIVHNGRLDRGVNLLTKPYGRLELARKLRAVLDEPSAAPAAAAAAAAAPAPAPAAAHKPGRLLILDDDPMVGKVLSLAAQKQGFQAEVTSRPPDFFNRVVQWQPSHVAIDLSMPEMNGLQVLDRLAQVGCTARIVISSGADAVQMNAALDHARALGLTVAGALPKPFSLAILQELLAADEPAAP